MWVPRSPSDIPNALIRVFLQDAGGLYDESRGLPPFRKVTPEVKAFFDNTCPYCGVSDTEAEFVEEHIVARNQKQAGLHAWGNVVWACRSCNRKKSGKDWRAFLATVAVDEETFDDRVRRIEQFQASYRYDPDVEALKAVLVELYRLADLQARGLIRFALTSASLVLGAMGGTEPDPAGLPGNITTEPAEAQ